jgi:hypothetical protein
MIARVRLLANEEESIYGHLEFTSQNPEYAGITNDLCYGNYGIA